MCFYFSKSNNLSFKDNIVSSIAVNDINITNSSNINFFTGSEVISISQNINLTSKYPPLWFSQSTLTEKHIASNLTNAINATVVVNPSSSWGSNCENINQVKYTTNSGRITLYQGQNAINACKSLTTSGIVLSIEPATNSNVLEFGIGTTPLVSNIMRNILIVFLALTVVIFAAGGIMMYVNQNFNSISTMDFVKYMVGGLILLIAVIILITNIINLT